MNYPAPFFMDPALSQETSTNGNQHDRWLLSTTTAQWEIDLKKFLCHGSRQTEILTSGNGKVRQDGWDLLTSSLADQTTKVSKSESES